MKRQLTFVLLASGLALMLIPFAFVLKSRVSAGNLKNHAPAVRAQLSDTVSVHAARRGFLFAESPAVPGISDFQRNLVSASMQDQSRSDVNPTTKPGRQASPHIPQGPAQANDNCASAISVNACPFTDSQDTTGAGDEVGEPQATCGSLQANSVWYTLTASANRRIVTVATCTSDFDTAVMVYRVTGGACVFAGFVPVACNDDFCGDGLQSQLEFSADAGQTYKIQVGGFDGETGSLTVDITCQDILCDDIVVNGQLGLGSPDYPAVSGQQTPARLFRDGIASTCAAPKVCPGPFNSGSFTFDAYTFTNESGEDQCVQVNYDPNSPVGNCNVNALAIAYLNSFSPTNLCLNYLADVGSSDALPFSFTVPAGADFVIVIAANSPGAGSNGCAYKFTVSGDLCSEPCTIGCPANVPVNSSPSQCAAAVDYPPPTVTGSCGAVTCTPPSGSVFAVGTTTVSCTTIGGPSCSFSVTVIDDTPPSINCSTGVTAPLPAGQLSGVVNYPAPAATDNCSVASVVCVPPSGSTFPAGATLVTCTATDASENSNRCFFFVTLLDGEPAVIRCPANVSAALAPGQTSAVVNYPAPTVTDNLPGVNVVCLPGSGSSFPAGSTTVTCTATDAGGNKSSCSFIVGVGGPQVKVTIPGNKTAVEFEAAPTRKPPKPKKNPCSVFTIENIGFAPLVLTFDSIARTGSSVDSGRITDPNDTRFFSLSLVNSDESLTPLDIGAVLTLQPGQVQNLCAKFAALIPALAGKTTGLAASNVLPDTLTSKIVFRQNAGADIAIPIVARVSTGLVLVNLSNPRRPPEVSFTRSANDITVSYGVFDSNLDVSRAKYEFLDSGGQVAAGPFEIDLAGPLSSANLVRGQSFSVEQRFTGASSNPEITGVRLTVFDGETSTGAVSTSSATTISAASIQTMNQTRGVALYTRDARLRP